MQENIIIDSKSLKVNAKNGFLVPTDQKQNLFSYRSIITISVITFSKYIFSYFQIDLFILTNDINKLFGR